MMAKAKNLKKYLLSEPQPIQDFCAEVHHFVKNKATKDEVSFIIKELEEMKAMLEEGKIRHSKSQTK